ncbi:MAG: FeoA family protein [Myxococcota bacterium]
MPELAASPISPVSTLDRIPRGEHAVVIGVTGDDPIARRLGDLGVREGVHIEVLRKAPLGDPTVYELCSYQLCLRQTESSRIQVRRITETSPIPPPNSTPSGAK